MTENDENLSERWARTLRNNPLAAAAVILAAIVGGVASFTDAALKIKSIFSPATMGSNSSRVAPSMVESPWKDYAGYKYLFGSYVGNYGNEAWRVDIPISNSVDIFANVIINAPGSPPCTLSVKLTQVIELTKPAMFLFDPGGEKNICGRYDRFLISPTQNQVGLGIIQAGVKRNFDFEALLIRSSQ
jgi:hypothetical protein